MHRPRKIPLRKCTGCQTMRNKKEMVRVVRTADNEFILDFTGKKSGRGAYLCPDMTCFEKAFKHKGLDRSFGQAIPPEIYGQLKTELQSMQQAGLPT